MGYKKNKNCTQLYIALTEYSFSCFAQKPLAGVSMLYAAHNADALNTGILNILLYLKTVSHKNWFIVLRIYGPEQPWIDQTCRPSELELVE